MLNNLLVSILMLLFRYTMQRAVSRRSESSEQEMDGIAEAELAKLQRQYRIMEGDRKAYCEESQNVIRRQRAQIQALQVNLLFFVFKIFCC